MSLDDLIKPEDGYGGHYPPEKKPSLWRRIAHAFRERQIYLRSEGDVQFFTLKPWFQVCMAVLIMMGLFWLAYASVNVAFKDQIIALKDYRAREARITYEDRLTSMRNAVDRLNGQLLLDQDQYLDQVGILNSEFEQLAERHRRIEQFFSQGWLPTKNINSDQSSTSGSGQGTSAPYSNPGFVGKSDFGKTAPATGVLKPSGKGSIFQKGSSLEQNETDAFKLKYAATFSSHEQARAPLAELRSKFALVRAKQIALLDAVEKDAATRIATAKKALKRIGLPAKLITRKIKTEELPIGGPFIDPKDPAFRDDVLGNKLLSAGQRIAEAEKLAKGLQVMPLVYPVRGYYRITSGFGVRRDPFRKRRAMHTGIDFKAAYGHKIRATAPGVVIGAGRKGAYGKVVEIRHAHGITTRYAHLSAIKTRVGRRVKAGDVIGNLGNTGRSTGPHLHYETRVFKRAISPRRFWKARKIIRE